MTMRVNSDMPITEFPMMKGKCVRRNMARCHLGKRNEVVVLQLFGG